MQFVFIIDLKPTKFAKTRPIKKNKSIKSIGDELKYIDLSISEKLIITVNAVSKNASINIIPTSIFNILPPKNSETSIISEFSKFLKSLLSNKQNNITSTPI